MSTSSNGNNETKNKILDAATQIFANQGYHGTKVDQIVEASSTSKGAVYFHFPSKQEIFLAIVDKFAILLEGQLLKAIEKESQGIDKVNVALSTCLETFGQYQSLAKIFLVQAAGLGLIFEEKQIEIHNRFAKVIQKHLDEAIAEGDMKPIDTEVAGYVWMGAINDVVIRWVRTGQPEPKRAIPTLRTMLLRSIGVDENRLQSIGDE
jgi:TetR/AcrR family transcriptional regulator, fatty acid metabolism regulator protein